MTGDIQDVKRAIAAWLASSAFLAVLTAVDTEKAVTQATPGPTQVFAGEKAVKTDQGFPVAEVLGIRTVYDTKSNQTKNATHEVEIVWTHVGDDELTIVAEIERLVRATRDLFWPQTGPATVVGLNSEPVELVREDYSPLMPGKVHPFLKAASTTLRVRTLTL